MPECDQSITKLDGDNSKLYIGYSRITKWARPCKLVELSRLAGSVLISDRWLLQASHANLNSHAVPHFLCKRVQGCPRAFNGCGWCASRSSIAASKRSCNSEVISWHLSRCKNGLSNEGARHDDTASTVSDITCQVLLISLIVDIFMHILLCFTCQCNSCDFQGNRKGLQ